mmetsp:Transcript_4/g.17  ORF Transcript_4/g.17 Transcript_4/m.17 type:complete len:248 (-) Transcript_4:1487-2230(-)
MGQHHAVLILQVATPGNVIPVNGEPASTELSQNKAGQVPRAHRGCSRLRSQQPTVQNRYSKRIPLSDVDRDAIPESTVRPQSHQRLGNKNQLFRELLSSQAIPCVSGELSSKSFKLIFTARAKALGLSLCTILEAHTNQRPRLEQRSLHLNIGDVLLGGKRRTVWLDRYESPGHFAWGFLASSLSTAWLHRRITARASPSHTPDTRVPAALSLSFADSCAQLAVATVRLLGLDSSRWFLYPRLQSDS